MSEKHPTTCRQCGKEFIPQNKAGIVPRFCSSFCRQRYRRPLVKVIMVECPTCHKEFTRKSVNGRKPRFCSDHCRCIGKREHITAYCIHCTRAFNPKTNTRLVFCSRECNYNHKTQQSQEVAFLHGLTKPLIEWPSLVACKSCGVFFDHKYGAKVCSEWCRLRVQKAYFDAKGEQQKIERRQRPHVSKTCPECGKEFNIQLRVERTHYCSNKCAAKVGRRKQRHKYRRVKGKGLGLYELAKRDNFKCQLCGKKVKMDKRTPHPLSPTVDHIVPLSEGGTNERSNLQLAHFWCNSKKGARSCGSQMLLIG